MQLALVLGEVRSMPCCVSCMVTGMAASLYLTASAAVGSNFFCFLLELRTESSDRITQIWGYCVTSTLAAAAQGCQLLSIFVLFCLSLA